MIITHIGLSKVAQRLIEQRVLDKNNIVLEGHPFLSDKGELSAISNNSYAKLNGLELIDEMDRLTFQFKGKPKKLNEQYQTCATIVHELDSDLNIIFCINKNTFRVLLGNLEVTSITNLNIKDNDNFFFNFNVGYDTFDLKIIINGEPQDFSGESTPIGNALNNASGYKDIYIGYNPQRVNDYWQGSIDLTLLSLSADDMGGEWQYELTPSFPSGFEFTRLLVSDGEIPLTDDSVATYQHIFDFPVNWGCNGTGLLFSAEISAETYLTIRELGLYFRQGGKDYLFGTMKGFPPIQKTKDIGYDLVFSIKIGSGVCNAWIFPDIRVKDPEYAKLSDLEKLELIHAYLVTDMERVINNNATLIGYEADEVFLQMFNQTRFISDNYTGTHQYARICQNIHPKSTRVFDREAIEVIGDPFILGSVIKNFSSSNFAYTLLGESFTNEWELEMSFQMPKSFQVQTIACLCDQDREPRLILGTDDTGSVYIRTSTGVLRRLFTVPNLKKTFIKIKYSGTGYTFYKRLATEPGWTKVGEVTSAAYLGNIGRMYLGVTANGDTISNPLIGTIDMSDITIFSNERDLSPSTITNRYIESEDFYHFVDYPASFYKIKNLKPMAASKIVYLEGSITGGIDSIDFGTPEGGSLVMTVDFADRNNKLILAKRKITAEQDPETHEITLEHEDYFTLEFIDFTLIATIYANNEVVELKKVYDIDTCNELIDRPVTITITSEYSYEVPEEDEGEPVGGEATEELANSEPVESILFSMYINNEKVAQEYCINPELPIANLYKITNYEVSPSEASRNYVSCIADFNGVLNQEEISYLCTILGTNN